MGPRGSKVTCWKVGKEFAPAVGAGAEVAVGGAGAGSQATGSRVLLFPRVPRSRWAQASLSLVAASARSNVTAGPRAGVRWAGPDLQGLRGL